MYHTSATRIYKVRHRSLGELRILKVISKAHMQGFSYEAETLRSLRHPGIPILYDYGEDEESICLIEEYIRGVSLQEYLLHHSIITRDWSIGILRQVCDILQYLHEQKPTPILYQDLKPEHVIIRGEQVILIDYGIAHPKGMRRYGAGTPQHGAPEQFCEAPVDERSDIYALGLLARELCDHQKERISAKEITSIEWALEADPKDRPATVKEWLASYDCPHAEEKKNGKHLTTEIAVIGAGRGVGTTHVALALTAYLNKHHKRAYYVNRSSDATLQRILQQRGEYREKDGIIYHNDFAGILDYGPAVMEPTPPNGIKVVDCGSDWSGARASDFYLYVCSSRPWLDMGCCHKKAMNPHCHILINPANRGVGHDISKKLRKKVYGFPLDSDPFLVTKEKEKLFQKIWESEE